MFEYSQSTGRFTEDGKLIWVGYSGHEEGINNPEDQSIQKVGPIPRGVYIIGKQETHPKLGPYAMALTPNEGTDTEGRSGFFIHGDNAEMNHTASEGCIILSRAARMYVSEAVEMNRNQLTVVD